MSSLQASGFESRPLTLLLTLLISVLGYFAADVLLRRMSKYNLHARLFGLDLNKKGSKTENEQIPEAMGIWPAFVFLLCVIGVQIVHSESTEHLAEYSAALHSICFMILLGFVDDVLELPWRAKLLLPLCASLPLVSAYSGGTFIVVPKILRLWLGVHLIDLHLFYKLYMVLLSIFTTSAINIFAGINGLEAGQSIVIALAVSIHNVVELYGPSAEAHFFSLTLMMPFIATTLALLKWNWFPSRVFVGDTFTTYAGMTFAVVGVLGHFSKTLLLFFIPQIFNFLYSTPQLFGLVHCPRHRLPKFNVSSGKLEGVRSNLNLLNLILLLVGPMTEKRLCVLLLSLQVLCCAVGFWVRYHLSVYFF